MQFNLERNLTAMRDQSPLVHNITNFVVMNFTANALLAAGASPVMAHAVEEVEDMVGIAGSLVVNIGTLSSHWVQAMALAMARASATGKPIVLDPVGAGATPFRNEVLYDLLQVASPDIIRGNASEILALAGANVKTKGVDSTAASVDSLLAAKDLSNQYNAVVSVSGAQDVIVYKDDVAYISNGVSLMARVTGMGCTATALAGAFAAVCPHKFDAAISAAAMMGVCGELAYQRATQPGSFQIAFLDALSELTVEEFVKRAKIQLAQ